MTLRLSILPQNQTSLRWQLTTIGEKLFDAEVYEKWTNALANPKIMAQLTERVQ